MRIFYPILVILTIISVSLNASIQSILIERIVKKKKIKEYEGSCYSQLDKFIRNKKETKRMRDIFNPLYLIIYLILNLTPNY